MKRLQSLCGCVICWVEVERHEYISAGVGFFIGICIYIYMCCRLDVGDGDVKG